MNVSKEKISGFELMFSITAFIQGSFLYVLIISSITKHDSWLVMLISLILGLILLRIYISLYNNYPGNNLVQINDIIYGKFIGKFVSIFYIYSFLIVLTMNIIQLQTFNSQITPDIPPSFYLISFVLVCSYAVFKGIEVICRISFLFVTIAYIIVIGTFLFLLKDMNISNLFPILDISLKNLFYGVSVMTQLCFGELIAFFTIITALNTKKYIKINILGGVLLGGISYIIIILRNTLVLGSSESINVSPSFQSTRIIDVGKLFTRMDILIAISQTIMIFFKCCILYHAVVISIVQLANLKSKTSVILPIGLLTILIALTSFQSLNETINLRANTAVYGPTLYTIIFPLLSLLITKIRFSKKQK